jgi:hypothetical protein
VSFNPSQPRVPAGQGGGGRWGAARDSKAAAAQKDTRAQQLRSALDSKKPADRGSYVKSLSDEDLQKLTAMLYSSRTSDPTVVAQRIAVANEMAKRGFDIKKFGALGGGSPAKAAPAKRATPAQVRAVAHVQARRAAAKSAPAKPAAKPAYKGPTQAPGVHQVK